MQFINKETVFSICIVSKNKSEIETNDGLTLSSLPNCLVSLAKLHTYLTNTEIIIADFRSDDWPLDEWVSDILKNKVRYKIVKVDAPFSRGLGRNIAFRHSQGRIIFFMDADMIIDNPDIFFEAKDIVRQDAAYFPVCYSYYNHQRKDGWWRHTGFGNLIVSRENFNKYGCWDEKRSWGGEDDKMFLTLARHISIVRKRAQGFYHQWHPDAPVKRKKVSWIKRLFGG